MQFPPPTPRQARVIWFAVTALAVALSVAIIGAVCWGLGQLLLTLSPVLWPIAVAGVVAFILDPVVGWLEQHRVPRLRAILLVFGGALLLVAGLFGSVVPRLVIEARDLAQRIPDYARDAQVRLENWVNHPPAPLIRFLPDSLRERFLGGTNSAPAVGGTNRVETPAASRRDPVVTNTPAPESPSDRGRRLPAPSPGGVTNLSVPEPAAGSSLWERILDPAAVRSAGGWLATVAPELGRWALGQVGRVASWFGALVGLALIPIYAFYFLLEKRSIERTWTDYLPVSDSKWKDELVWLLQNINDALIVFFRGQVLVAICDGVMYTVGFLAIGLPYAVLLGAVATVLTIVPFLGAIVTCASALIIAVVQFGDWQHPLAVMGVFVVVQTIEGWVVQPKIIGDRVGLHPVTIIVALLVGTTLMGGILGGLLAIPATAVLRALMFRYVWRRAGT